jgi:hypothetical protein
MIEEEARDRAAAERKKRERSREAARHAVRLRESAAEDREEWKGDKPEGA